MDFIIDETFDVGQKFDYNPKKDYIVEKIVGCREGPHGKEFRVLWKGYPPSQSSWVHVDDLNCDKLISDYFKRYEAKRKPDMIVIINTV